MYPLLRPLGVHIHSAITGSYIPGHHSVLLVNCPNEQAAKDIGRYWLRAILYSQFTNFEYKLCTNYI